jgi:hypothetical protein
MKNKLFNLDLFNPDFAVFPKMVFKERFEHYYFMTFNDWFHQAFDYKMLQMFLEAINEPYLYCAVPDFYNCPTIKIDVSKSHAYFLKRYLLEDRPKHPHYHIGLRVSPCGFWYGKSMDWAIVSDLTNDIMIIGLKPAAALNFRADFGGKYFDIEQVIHNMENLHYILQKRQDPTATWVEMDDKLAIIEQYK